MIPALYDDPTDDMTMLEEREETSDGVTLKEMVQKQRQAEQNKIEEAISVTPLSTAPPSVSVTALASIQPPVSTLLRQDFYRVLISDKELKTIDKKKAS